MGLTRPSYDELAERCRQAEAVAARLMEAEDRARHLKQVLLGIRDVDRLIAEEHDAGGLLTKACDSLTASLGYHNAWCALFDDAGAGVTLTAASGFGEAFAAIEESLRGGRFPACVRMAVAQAAPVVMEDPSAVCPDCPVSHAYGGRSGLVRRLACDGRVRGVLAVSVPAAYAGDSEEQWLFNELADDLGSALGRIETEKALARLEQVVFHTPQAISLVSSDYRYLTVNSVYARYFGRPRQDIIGCSVADLCGRELFETAIKPHLDRCLAGEQIRYEIQTDFAAKGPTWMEMHYFPYRDGGGRVQGVISHGIDISQRKERETEYAAILATTTDGFCVVDSGGRIREANPAAARMVGYTVDEVEGMRVEDIEVTDTPDDVRRRIELLREIGYSQFETRHRCKDGRIIDVEVSASYVSSPRECIVSFARDITARKRAEEALRESEQRFQLIADVTTDLIYVWHIDTDVLEWYGDLDTALGYEPGAIPRTIQGWESLLHPDDAPRMIEAIEHYRHSSDPIRQTYRMRRQDGSWACWEEFGAAVCDAAGKPLRWIGGCRDITREQSLEEQYLQAQKMEAVGQLTGGVAHDFNNLLQVINGATELARMDLEPDHPAYAALAEVAEAGERAARLVSQLLLFSRRQIMRPEALDLNEVVADLLKMLGRIIGEQVQLEWRPGPRVGWIHADRSMVEQALTNLCVNARDAMAGGGTLSIETRELVIDEAFARTRPWAQSGRYALLSVVDTGCGMDRATLERVFEPFFTTKEPGKGTGLGLATVYGIVKQHGGLVHVDSDPGRGSQFQLYWPAATVEECEREAAADAVIVGGTETLLLAEDDALVRRLTRRLLEQAGYHVLEAANGAEAVALFNERAGDIDLAVLDAVMPEMSGREAFARMQDRRPSLKALFASGYSEDAIHTNFVLEEGLSLLQKPFTRLELLQAVRTVLDAPEPVRREE